MVHFHEVWADTSDILSHTDQPAMEGVRKQHSSGDWGRRRLRGVAQTPVPSESGGSLATRGWPPRAVQAGRVSGPGASCSGVSHPWRALGTSRRLRGTHDRGWLQVWAFHTRQRDILSRSHFWFVALLLPASRLCSQLPPALARRRPSRRPFVWRPPRSPLLSRVPPRERWLSADCREGRRWGDRAKFPHPHRAGPPAYTPSPPHGVPSPPRRGLR